MDNPHIYPQLIHRIWPLFHKFFNRLSCLPEGEKGGFPQFPQHLLLLLLYFLYIRTDLRHSDFNLFGTESRAKESSKHNQSLCRSKKRYLIYIFNAYANLHPVICPNVGSTLTSYTAHDVFQAPKQKWTKPST